MKIAIKMFLLNMYRTDAAFCCLSITHSMCLVYLKCQEAGHEPVTFTSLPVHNQQLKKNLLTVTSNVRLTFFGIKGVLLSSFGSNAFSMTTKTALWYILTQSEKKIQTSIFTYTGEFWKLSSILIKSPRHHLCSQIKAEVSFQRDVLIIVWPKME